LRAEVGEVRDESAGLGRNDSVSERAQRSARLRVAGCGIRNVRLALAVAAGALAALLPAMVSAWCYRHNMAYPLTAAQAHLGELVAETRQSHRPVTISEHGKPVAALISIDDLADLEDRAALAAHLADKAAGRGGISLDALDAALDQMDAETLS
jgi:prevent-host-death family protein